MSAEKKKNIFNIWKKHFLATETNKSKTTHEVELLLLYKCTFVYTSRIYFIRSIWNHIRCFKCSATYLFGLCSLQSVADVRSPFFDVVVCIPTIPCMFCFHRRFWFSYFDFFFLNFIHLFVCSFLCWFICTNYTFNWYRGIAKQLAIMPKEYFVDIWNLIYIVFFSRFQLNYKLKLRQQNDKKLKKIIAFWPIT